VTFSAAALALLKNYNWPGNIRELENAVLHAVSLSDDVVYPEHLPVRLKDFKESGPDLADSAADFLGGDSLKNTENAWPQLARMEELYVARVLEHTGGNKQAAARLLNIDRKTLGRIISRGSSDTK
jgi:DNA-binding NtrC family response regulator